MTAQRHQEVVTGLLDLQAKLRAETDAASGTDEGSRVIRLPGTHWRSTQTASNDDSISVIEGDVEVSQNPDAASSLASVTPLPLAGSKERMAALSTCLQRLERDLASVMTRIRGNDDAAKRAGSTKLLSSASDDHFVRLQREIARRLDKERDPAN